MTSHVRFLDDLKDLKLRIVYSIEYPQDSSPADLKKRTRGHYQFDFSVVGEKISTCPKHNGERNKTKNKDSYNTIHFASHYGEEECGRFNELPQIVNNPEKCLKLEKTGRGNKGENYEHFVLSAHTGKMCGVSGNLEIPVVSMRWCGNWLEVLPPLSPNSDLIQNSIDDDKENLTHDAEFSHTFKFNESCTLRYSIYNVSEVSSLEDAFQLLRLEKRLLQKLPLKPNVRYGEPKFDDFCLDLEISFLKMISSSFKYVFINFDVRSIKNDARLSLISGRTQVLQVDWNQEEKGAVCYVNFPVEASVETTMRHPSVTIEIIFKIMSPSSFLSISGSEQTLAVGRMTFSHKRNEPSEEKLDWNMGVKKVPCFWEEKSKLDLVGMLICRYNIFGLGATTCTHF